MISNNINHEQIQMKEKWVLKKRNFNSNAIDKDHSSEILTEILSRRDIHSEKELYEYLNKDRSIEHDPFLFKNMDTAVEILIDKIKNKKKILLALDYDVDGIISGAIAFLGLKHLGVECAYIFPHRITDGYGLNDRMVDYAKDHNFDTIITFDNGISSFDSINRAKTYGITTIVTDHHEIPKIEENNIVVEKLVDADIVINPKQSSCNYPYSDICGAMIAYKLILALYRRLGVDETVLRDLYSLVSIATICDVMDLKDENRIFVDYGLRILKNSDLCGIKALLHLLKLDSAKNLRVTDIGFQIGPILNSSGRLKSADLALNMLICENYEEALNYADELITLNKERKSLTKDSTTIADKIVQDNKLYQSNIIIIYLENTHESLAGIIAGRIKEEYNISTIVFTDSTDCIKGSARATETVNIFEELSKFKKYFLKFGGHAAAAGLSLTRDNFDKFHKEIVDYFNELKIDNTKIQYVDSIIDINKVDLNLAKNLSVFEPTGKGNPSLVFSSLNLTLKKIALLGEFKNVLKLDFESNHTIRSFISFAPQNILKKIKSKMEFDIERDIIEIDLLKMEHINFDLLYRVNINYFNNKEYLNLEIISIR